MVASVGAMSFGDRVVARQHTAAERIYCKNVRIDPRTGWETQCGSPFYTDGRKSWCRVCDVMTRLVNQLPRVPPSARAVHSHERNQWHYNITMSTLNDKERGLAERSLRPRAIVDDTEPYWQCSSREVLEEMGIDSYVMANAEAMGVRGYEQLDPKMQRFLDDPGKVEQTSEQLLAMSEHARMSG